MICVGTTSGQSHWDLRCPEIHKRRGRNFEKHQQNHQQLSVHSSLEVPARPPNSPHNCPLASQRIETIARFCSFTAPIGFRSQRKWDVIDLVPQETGSDTAGRRGGTPPYASSFRPPSSKKGLTFALPAGETFEFRNKKSQSWRKVSTLIRAERISKERRSGRSSEYESSTENEGDGVGDLPDDTSMWDSNAEGVRRGRYKKKINVSSEVPPRDRSQKQQEFEYDGEVISSRSRAQKNQEWEFDVAEQRGRDQYERDEWDYDAEARTSRSQKGQAEDSRWWQSREDNYAYDSDGETGEASTSFRDMFSWVNADVKDAFVFIRWGLPAAVLLVPWLMGNPMMLVLALSFIPAANKFIGPIVNSIFRTVMAGASPPKPKRRKQNTGSSPSSRRSQQAQRSSSYYEREAPAASNSTVVDPPESDLFTSVSTTIFGDPNVDDVPRKPPRLGRSNGNGSGTTKRLGGWEDLEEDRARSRSERWPMDRRSSSRRSEKKIVKREERNIFVRLILALFPFLRYWGGLM